MSIVVVEEAGLESNTPIRKFMSKIKKRKKILEK